MDYSCTYLQYHLIYFLFQTLLKRLLHWTFLYLTNKNLDQKKSWNKNNYPLTQFKKRNLLWNTFGICSRSLSCCWLAVIEVLESDFLTFNKSDLFLLCLVILCLYYKIKIRLIDSKIRNKNENKITSFELVK